MGNHNAYGTEKGAIKDRKVPPGMPAAPHGPNDGKAPRAGLPPVSIPKPGERILTGSKLPNGTHVHDAVTGQDGVIVRVVMLDGKTYGVAADKNGKEHYYRFGDLTVIKVIALPAPLPTIGTARASQCHHWGGEYVKPACIERIDMKGEGRFTIDGTNIEYEYRFMAGDALPYKVRFREGLWTWSGDHPFEDAESREDFLWDYVDRWVNAHKWWFDG